MPTPDTAARRHPPNCCEGHYYAGMGRCGDLRPAELLDVVADPPAAPAPLVDVELVAPVIETPSPPCRWCGDIPERRQASGDSEHGQVDEGPGRAEPLPAVPAQGSDAL